jgi:DNA-binding CsgD family transcriptional regulator
MREPRAIGMSLALLDAKLFDLHCAVGVEMFWQATRHLLEGLMSLHSCSLMLNIVGTEPVTAHHHVVYNRDAHYKPPSNLKIVYEYLNRHRKVRLYTFSQVVAEDPHAIHRRIEQLGDWTEFVHLAFWDGERPDAVLSLRREGSFSGDELEWLNQLHPAIDAAIRRLRIIEGERFQRTAFERFVRGLPIPAILLTSDEQLSFATDEGYEACAIWNRGERGARALNPRRTFELPLEIAAACSRLRPPPKASDLVESIRHRELPMVARIECVQPGRGPWARPGFLVTFNRDEAQRTNAHEQRVLRVLQALSPCERRVALLAAEGYRNREIALRLNRSGRTIEYQLNSIYRKMNLQHRAQLVRALN